MTSDKAPKTLIYDWNAEAPSDSTRRLRVIDETLRDGLQGGVPRVPTTKERIELISMAAKLGIDEATVGFPAQAEASRQAIAILNGVLKQGVDIRFGLLGRTLEKDIRAIHHVQQETGASVTAWLFLGASPIRRYAEKWDIERLTSMAKKSLALAGELGLAVNFGIEDSIRAEPELVETLIRIGAEQGVQTATICDTVGHLTPYGTERAMRHFRAFVDDNDFRILLDYHGHRDRGLALANALAAARSGADSIHGTILSIGERAGNTPLDLLLVNLKLMGQWPGDLTGLSEYCRKVAEYCRLEIPENYPVFGANAFRTQAGVHSAAIWKAESQGEGEIARQVYAGVDPHMIGLDYDIRVGPDSGRSNVQFVLKHAGLEADHATIDEILFTARTEKRLLPNDEVIEMATTLGALPVASPPPASRPSIVGG